MTPVTIELTLKIVHSVWDWFKKKKTEKMAQAAEFELIAKDADVLYDLCAPAIAALGPLLAEKKAGVRTWREIFLPLKAHIEVIVEKVGEARGHMPEGHRDRVIAVILARALHEATKDEDVIPLLDDTEAIYLLIAGSNELWRAKRAAKDS